MSLVCSLCHFCHQPLISCKTNEFPDAGPSWAFLLSSNSWCEIWNWAGGMKVSLCQEWKSIDACQRKRVQQAPCNACPFQGGPAVLYSPVFMCLAKETADVGSIFLLPSSTLQSGLSLKTWALKTWASHDLGYQVRFLVQTEALLGNGLESHPG